MYQPEPPTGGTLADLTNWILREFYRIGNAIGSTDLLYIDFRSVEPKKPKEGMICGADGTNWNPGSGKGFYGYYTGAWHLLG